MINKLLKYFLSVSFVFLFLFSPIFLLAHAQLSGCAEVDVGNPPANQSIPPQCSGSSSSSSVVQKVIQLAKTYLKGYPYVWGGPNPRPPWSKYDPKNNPPKSFDCSGFVGWAWYWGSNGKVNMQGQTTADWTSDTKSPYTRVTANNLDLLHPGDIVYFGSPGESSPSHVGLFIGKDTCGSNYCYLQYSDPQLKGNESDMKKDISSYWRYWGFIRPNVQ